jgi:hypothetical protein
MRELTNAEWAALNEAMRPYWIERDGLLPKEETAFEAGFIAGIERQRALLVDEISLLSNVLTLVYNAGPRAWHRADHPIGQRIRAALASVEPPDGVGG